MNRPKTAVQADRFKSASMKRPRSATRPTQRSTSCSSSAGVRTSSPSGSEHPPELDISCVSAISIFSRDDATRKTVDGSSSRQAQLDKYRMDKETKEQMNDILEAKALTLEAELTWALPPDLLEKQKKINEIRKRIAENIRKIDLFLEFCSRVPLLLNAQSAVDVTQKHLDSVTLPSPEHVATLEGLVNLLKGAQLVEGGVLLPQGDELERLKPRIEQLFSNEEQKALKNAKIYAENMARLAENMDDIEAASGKLIQIEKLREIWQGHVKSLEESLELLEILKEERQQNFHSL